ncbi:hypothetical protein [Spirillospora sp. CA-294931]|uniref:hypothetical protein n=1 Tax=Spirillospora sp. CA-294931 TaxID=3240042 RepID=UPI003D9084F8
MPGRDLVVTAFVLACLAGLFALNLPRLLRPMPSAPVSTPTAPAAAGAGEYPESMTAELEPGDEEYLAFLADNLWPEDEYLELEASPDSEEDGGGTSRCC